MVSVDNSLPTKKFRERHRIEAVLIGWDSDGFGVYECRGEGGKDEGHGLLEDGNVIGLGFARMFTKL